MRMKPRAPVALPVLAAVPPGGGAGLAMSAFEIPPTPGIPDDYNVKVTLTNAGSVELVLWAEDVASWGIASQTGNLGMLGGQGLVSPGVYFFPARGLAGFKSAVLVAQNNVGAVAIAASLTPIVDALKG